MTRFHASILAASLLAIPAGAAVPLKLHISKSGSDAAACTVQAPCKTLHGAQARIPAGGKAVVLTPKGRAVLCTPERCIK